MSGKSSARRRRSFVETVQELKTVPTAASEIFTSLHPIQDGTWRTGDQVSWRLHRELSSAGTIRELLAAPATRVLWVDGPEARELSVSEAVAAWSPVERDFKQQYRRNGDPALQIAVAEFRDPSGRILVIIEAAC